MLGLWMLETLSSPLAEVVTASFAVFPSDPGAPLGHRAISVGGSAARSESGSRKVAKSGGAMLIGSSDRDGVRANGAHGDNGIQTRRNGESERRH